MSIYNIGLFSLILLSLVTACSNEKSVPPLLQNPTNNVIEGQLLEVSFNEDIQVTNISVLPNAEFPIFQIPRQDKTILIVPNVQKKTSVTYSVQFTTTEGTEGTETITLNIVPVELDIPATKPEPNTFSGTVTRYENATFDGAGVPLLEKQGQLQYVTTYIAAYAYNYYSQYYTSNDADDYAKFMNAANWLKNNCMYTKYGFCSWRFDFKYTSWQVESDWVSAMGQGQALSSLLAAAYVTQDPEYLEVAYDAMSAFLYPVIEKGVSSYTTDHHIWYEEYGSETFSSGILNGFLFSLSGIRSLQKAYPDLALANFLMENGIAALVERLPYLDNNFTSFYNCSDQLAPEQCLLASAKGSTDVDAYHELHFYQLGWLASIVDNPVIEEYINKFVMYDFGVIMGSTKVRESGLDVKIETITASHSNDAKRFFPKRMIDENWTTGKYWSTSKSNTYIDVVLNEDFLEAPALEGIVLTAINLATMPDIIKLYYLDQSEDEIWLQDILLDKTAMETYVVDGAGFTSTTTVIPIEQKINSRRLRLYMSNANTVALKEINFLYERTRLNALLKEVYLYK